MLTRARNGSSPKLLDFDPHLIYKYIMLQSFSTKVKFERKSQHQIHHESWQAGAEIHAKSARAIPWVSRLHRYAPFSEKIQKRIVATYGLHNKGRKRWKGFNTWWVQVPKKQNKRRSHPLAVLEGSLPGTIADQFVWCRGKCTRYTDTSCKFHLWITILIKLYTYDLLFRCRGYTLLIPAVLVDLYQYPSFTLPCPLSPKGMLYFDCDLLTSVADKISNTCTSWLLVCT